MSSVLPRTLVCTSRTWPLFQLPCQVLHPVFFDNIFEEISEEGEYFLNVTEGLLYLIPPAEMGQKLRGDAYAYADSKAEAGVYLTESDAEGRRVRATQRVLHPVGTVPV